MSKFLFVLSSVLIATGAYSQTYELVFESDTDVNSDEVYRAQFASQSDLISGATAEQGFTANTLPSNYSSTGFEFDGQYRMIIESDQDVNGAEFYFATFNTLNDFLTQHPASGGFHRPQH